jgi:hypothetical protein
MPVVAKLARDVISGDQILTRDGYRSVVAVNAGPDEEREVTLDLETKLLTLPLARECIIRTRARPYAR